MEKQFKVYKSSAGSGKTFTLVKEYLKLCLKEESSLYFSHVLAITFTNKATYEMKERILSALQLIAEHDPKSINDPLIDILSKELNQSPLQLKEKCSDVLSAIVHNYGDFSISTIDRFSHRLIRTFAKDLGLPLNFNVEVDEKRLLEETVARLLSEVGKNKVISNWLFAFAFYQLEEDKSWRIENELFDFARKMLGEQNRFYLQALKKCSSDDFEKLRVKLKKENREFEKAIKEIGQKGVNLIEQKSIPLASFARGKTGIGSYFKYLSYFDKDKLTPNSYARKTIEDDKPIISLVFLSTLPSAKALVSRLNIRFRILLLLPTILSFIFARYSLNSSTLFIN
jgi:ATP-dependent exoDNAse (exonuclease V) beta subunit